MLKQTFQSQCQKIDMIRWGRPQVGDKLELDLKKI